MEQARRRKRQVRAGGDQLPGRLLRPIDILYEQRGDGGCKDLAQDGSAAFQWCRAERIFQCYFACQHGSENEIYTPPVRTEV